MTFNPHTTEDRKEMLATIGIDSTDALFEPVPANVRYPELDLPRALTEMEAAHKLQQLASRNVVLPAEDVYLGAGSYQHYVPATVGQILARGEFYTAYTPYQPEVAQGTLQVIYEFQSMVAELLGVEVANASMYDGATAFAEGCLMTVAASRKKNRVVLAGTVHPAYRDVVHTYLDGSGVEVIDATSEDPFVSTVDDLKQYLRDDLACIAIQYPNFYGGIEDVRAVADLAHEHGALLVVSTSPVPLGSRQSLVRQMPGRIAGITTDAEGKRGYVLTLQTREQHIRREKATSNICTNQGLMATAATVYMSSLGPEGFREVSRASYQNAHYLANRLTELDGFELAFDVPFFHEFTVKTERPAAEINAKLLDAGILGGLDLGRFDDGLAHHLLLCATELNTRSGIDRFIEVVSR
jgi:glycine dehydrogenase subunit 1